MERQNVRPPVYQNQNPGGIIPPGRSSNPFSQEILQPSNPVNPSQWPINRPAGVFNQYANGNVPSSNLPPRVVNQSAHVRYPSGPVRHASDNFAARPAASNAPSISNNRPAGVVVAAANVGTSPAARQPDNAPEQRPDPQEQLPPQGDAQANPTAVVRPTVALQVRAQYRNRSFDISPAIIPKLRGAGGTAPYYLGSPSYQKVDWNFKFEIIISPAGTPLPDGMTNFVDTFSAQDLQKAATNFIYSIFDANRRNLDIPLQFDRITRMLVMAAVQRAPIPVPAIQQAIVPSPGIQRAPIPAATNQRSPISAAVVKRAPIPVPAIQQAIVPSPGIQPAPVPSPAIQRAAAPSPAIQRAPAPSPAIQQAPVPAPVIQHAPVPAPAIQQASIPAPAIQRAPAPLPAIQQAPAPSSAIQRAPAPSTAIQPAPMPAAAIQPAPTPAQAIQRAPVRNQVDIQRPQRPASADAELSYWRPRQQEIREPASHFEEEAVSLDLSQRKEATSHLEAEKEQEAGPLDLSLGKAATSQATEARATKTLTESELPSTDGPPPSIQAKVVASTSSQQSSPRASVRIVATTFQQNEATIGNQQEQAKTSPVVERSKQKRTYKTTANPTSQADVQIKSEENVIVSAVPINHTTDSHASTSSLEMSPRDSVGCLQQTSQQDEATIGNNQGQAGTSPVLESSTQKRTVMVTANPTSQPEGQNITQGNRIASAEPINLTTDSLASTSSQMSARASVGSVAPTLQQDQATIGNNQEHAGTSPVLESSTQKRTVMVTANPTSQEDKQAKSQANAIVSAAPINLTTDSVASTSSGPSKRSKKAEFFVSTFSNQTDAFESESESGDNQESELPSTDRRRQSKQTKVVASTSSLQMSPRASVGSVAPTSQQDQATIGNNQEHAGTSPVLERSKQKRTDKTTANPTSQEDKQAKSQANAISPATPINPTTDPVASTSSGPSKRSKKDEFSVSEFSNQTDSSESESENDESTSIDESSRNKTQGRYPKRQAKQFVHFVPSLQTSYVKKKKPSNVVSRAAPVSDADDGKDKHCWECHDAKEEQLRHCSRCSLGWHTERCCSDNFFETKLKSMIMIIPSKRCKKPERRKVYDDKQAWIKTLSSVLDPTVCIECARKEAGQYYNKHFGILKNFEENRDRSILERNAALYVYTVKSLLPKSGCFKTNKATGKDPFERFQRIDYGTHEGMDKIDLQWMLEKAQTIDAYQCTEDFIFDIKKICHSYMILQQQQYGIGPGAIMYKEFMEKCNQLINTARIEMKFINRCESCYRNYFEINTERVKSDMVMPCENPHALVWIVHHHLWWPAKVYEYRENQYFFTSEKYVNVVPFGSENKAYWTLHKLVRSFSKHPPESSEGMLASFAKHKPQKKDLLRANLKEALSDAKKYYDKYWNEYFTEPYPLQDNDGPIILDDLYLKVELKPMKSILDDNFILSDADNADDDDITEASTSRVEAVAGPSRL